ncbi:MAG: flagellar hook-basal body complex protein FliE [Gammaproteobacteria bacterium]|nr:MAG: flagellar hook-basal body complex protein FliE [Gammaproteobacteria bacterium]
MSELKIDDLLRHIREAQARIEAGGTAPAAPDAARFADLLERSLEAVNAQQQKAGALAEELQRGEAEVSLAQVMIEMQKARVSFEALTQVRNKLIDAYRDIMNMPI